MRNIVNESVWSSNDENAHLSVSGAYAKEQNKQEEENALLAEGGLLNPKQATLKANRL